MSRLEPVSGAGSLYKNASSQELTQEITEEYHASWVHNSNSLVQLNCEETHRGFFFSPAKTGLY